MGLLGKGFNSRAVYAGRLQGFSGLEVSMIIITGDLCSLQLLLR